MDGAYPLTKSGRLQGQVFVGIRRDQFDDAETYRVDSDTNSTDMDDMNNSLNVGVMLRYLMGRRTTITFQYVRTTAFSLHANYQDVDRADLGVTRVELMLWPNTQDSLEAVGEAIGLLGR